MKDLAPRLDRGDDTDADAARVDAVDTGGEDGLADFDLGLARNEIEQQLAGRRSPHHPLPARALQLDSGGGGAVGEQLDFGVGARNADHPPDEAVVRKHRLVAMRRAGADVEHQGAQPGAVVGVHDLGDPQGGRVAALEGEGPRQPFDLLLEALHAQFAAPQLEELLAQPPVLRREVVPAAQALAGRRDSLRARVDSAGERPETAQRGALEEVRGAALVRLLRRDEEELADQQDGEEEADAARAHDRGGIPEEAARVETSRAAHSCVSIIGPSLFTLSISGSRPSAAGACPRGRGRCPEPRRPAGLPPGRPAGRSRPGCARRAPAAGRRRPTARFPCP